MDQIFEIKDFHKRLDEFLSVKLKISKNQALHLIKNSLVFLNGLVCKKGGQKLKIGDKIIVLKPNAIDYEKPLVDIDVAIIYEDEDILILNKPPGIVIHPAPSVKDFTLVDWLSSKGFLLSNLSGEERYGIVHRLDKDTSGALLIAKNNNAHMKLSEQLKNRDMGRYYLAVIEGNIKEKIVFECQIGRNPKNRLKMANIDTFRRKNIPSRYSKSDFLPLLDSKDSSMSLVAAKLYTGRTHQIRVHLEALGKHIIGDKVYGKKDILNTRMLLHAYLIYFIHPTTGKKMFFKVPVFDDMLEFLAQNFDGANLNEVTKEDFILYYFNTI
ncbi:RluA family pseudouridine synthase [Helicobacter sp. 13S00477-4]|uniref:RluA family pseudouridine synthase n=1 Tax=Helicobacter sp. 13S00477-4 TaxID=1905759 RepID=UPI000BA67F55|nr:RluA family pseudouridine synthase [Helicobacter sp. 13S00477-4]PAF51018.1 RNA pseudouridine synthase [Helicobacter sp. 13S00477-4]